MQKRWIRDKPYSASPTTNSTTCCSFWSKAKKKNICAGIIVLLLGILLIHQIVSHRQLLVLNSSEWSRKQAARLQEQKLRKFEEQFWRQQIHIHQNSNNNNISIADKITRKLQRNFLLEMRLKREMLRQMKISYQEPPPHRKEKYKTPNRKRRPRLVLPKFEELNCSLKRMKHVPAFTRHRRDQRPKYAVISLVASKNGTADNVTRRETMHALTFINKLNYCHRHGYDLIIEGDDAVDPRRKPHWSKIRVLRKWLPFYDWVVWMDQDTLIMNFDYTIEDMVRTRLEYRFLRELDFDETSFQFSSSSSAKQQQQQTKTSSSAASNYNNIKKDSTSSKNNNISNFPEKEEDDENNNNNYNFHFNEPQTDFILTADQNNINSGIMFIRNSSWSLDFLRRAWKVDQRDASPFNDQGAFLFLINPLKNHISAAVAEIDRTHFWIIEDNFINSYAANLIHQDNQLAGQFEEGDWIIHFSSCKYFHFCMDWLKHYYNRSLCENIDFDADDFDSNENILGDAPENFKTPKNYLPPETEEFLNKLTFPPLSEYDPIKADKDYYSSAKALEEAQSQYNRGGGKMKNRFQRKTTAVPTTTSEQEFQRKESLLVSALTNFPLVSNELDHFSSSWLSQLQQTEKKSIGKNNNNNVGVAGSDSKQLAILVDLLLQKIRSKIYSSSSSSHPSSSKKIVLGDTNNNNNNNNNNKMITRHENENENKNNDFSSFSLMQKQQQIENAPIQEISSWLQKHKSFQYRRFRFSEINLQECCPKNISVNITTTSINHNQNDEGADKNKNNNVTTRHMIISPTKCPLYSNSSFFIRNPLKWKHAVFSSNDYYYSKEQEQQQHNFLRRKKIRTEKKYFVCYENVPEIPDDENDPRKKRRKRDAAIAITIAVVLVTIMFVVICANVGYVLASQHKRNKLKQNLMTASFNVKK